ncbi:MAG: 3-deoxy-D-manno-octulosonic acid transferase [Bacteroidetes bacterium]|nr:3-deoxy-D-manno-octulosonic acid transferase [Bacteroidota bacterium]
MRILYNLGIYLYYFGIFFYSFFNLKAKKWWVGRKNILQKCENLFNKNENIAWFHSASLGEFEQGRPVIEKFKLQHPDFKIVLTFFSPSGYEVRKNYETADYILYLPIDTPYNVRKFIEIVNPQIVFFIKYEFWFNYLKALYDKKIPVYLISGIFRPQQHFFKFYGGWFRKQLKHFSYFFVQSEASKELLHSIKIKNVTISGDTRFDRVIAIAATRIAFPLIEKFKASNSILLSGSSWEADEAILIDFMKLKKTNLRYIIAPHEIHKERIQQLQEKLPLTSLLFSQANEININEAKVLIIDNIGILSNLYQYATIALIGGGFGKGIHNILEAATFGTPILFGPNYHKFSEAIQLIALGGAFECIDNHDFITKANLLFDNMSLYEHAKEQCINYVNMNKGATEIILQHILLQHTTELF